eukprot:g1297.t1
MATKTKADANAINAFLEFIGHVQERGIEEGSLISEQNSLYGKTCDSAREREFSNRSKSLCESQFHFPDKYGERSNLSESRPSISEGFCGRPRSISIGAYSPEERRRRIERYLDKRKRRVWTKRTQYRSRKKVADGRLRIKGRFVSKKIESQMMLLANGNVGGKKND